MRRLRLPSAILRGLATGVACAAALGISAPEATAAEPTRWCGNDVSAVDRFPDAVAGPQVRVVYVTPADGPDRFAELAGGIAGDMAAIDAWWRREDATRAPRFDLFDFPGCDSVLGRLDIASARLPKPASAYDLTTISAVSDAIYRDLRAAPALASAHPLKKHLIFYDGPARRLEDACAVSYGDPANVAFLYLQPPVDGCPPIDVGAGEFTAMVTAHELVHNLGGTGRAIGAPHQCNGGHVCDAEADIIFGTPIFRPLLDRVLDAGRDDYYAHSGAWFDVQDSPFLSRVTAPQRQLNVGISGEGTVRTDLPGLVCPPQCATAWDSGTGVVLEARPKSGSQFVKWTGACTGAYWRCRLTVSRPRDVSAQFAKRTSPATGTTRNWTPFARIAFLTRTAYEPGERIVLRSQSRDRDGTLAVQEWDFGDGGRASGASVSHSYAKPGKYTITLRVVDNRDAAASVTTTVTIRPSPPEVYAYGAFVFHGDKAQLRYRARDNAALARVRITVLKGKRVVHTRVVRTRESNLTSAYAWRSPRTRSDRRWCIRAWDNRGYASERSCAEIRIF